MMTNGSDLPTHEDAYPCVGLGREEQVYDYYNGMLVGDEAREFEAHLLDCFTCRRKIATVDWINGMLKTELLPVYMEAGSDGFDEDTSSTEQNLIPEPLVSDTTAIYIVVGGLSVLGLLGLGVVKLVAYTRQKRSLAALSSEPVGSTHSSR